MQPDEIIAAGVPCDMFEQWVHSLREAGIEARQVSIAEYDRQTGYSPQPHPRGQEVYVLVPGEKRNDALEIIKRLGG
jgi:hypothetical protein